MKTRLGKLSESSDEKMTGIEQLKVQMKRIPFHHKRTGNDIFGSVSSMKSGINVLYSILNGNNISQYGKQEALDVKRVLWLTDPELAARLDRSNQPLTPKETFYCIMERYERSDKDKMASFCCTDQALRSMKSRLNKKREEGTL